MIGGVANVESIEIFGVEDINVILHMLVGTDEDHFTSFRFMILSALLSLFPCGPAMQTDSAFTKLQ